MKIRTWSAVGCMLLMAELAAGAGELSTLATSLEDAHYARDSEALETLADSLTAIDSAGARYFEAYAHFRLGELADDNKKAAKKHFNTCIKILKDEVKANPEDAEAQGLLGTCFGSSTVFYMLRAATRGAASDKALKIAQENAPENPRVLMHSGISLFYRPGAFGGDKAKALEQFAAATDQFAAAGNAGQSAEPTWGEPEAWAYVARARAALDQPDAARAAYRRALELRPDYALAAEELAGLGDPAAD